MASTHTFFKRYGANRLLKLALILDTADKLHEKKGEPTYCQEQYRHFCGTPACALGHWAAANPKRWTFDKLGFPFVARGLESGVHSAVDEFGISYSEVVELFHSNGCGKAKTAKEAARYIRAFVKRKLKAIAKESRK